MDENKSIEIPFGAKDSELKGWEYTIPEGMEAEIKDGKIIVREKESEDERMRKKILALVKKHAVNDERCQMEVYLEKQGEHKPLSTEETELNSLAFLTELGYTCIPPTKEKSNSWSEEDERIRYAICDTLDRTDERIMEYNSQLTHQRVKEWLKALKERYTWKPSDVQIECLSDAIKHYNSLGHPATKLKELLDDLKKLKE